MFQMELNFNRMTTHTMALKPEVDTELCRVKLEGNHLGGYTAKILTENISARELTMLKCPRCDGIMKEASITSVGEPLCVCCKCDYEIAIPNAFVRKTILSLNCVCPLSERGCEWLGTIEGVENHLIICIYVYTSCELMCGAVETRATLVNHMQNKCVQRTQACDYCEALYKVCEMNEHWGVCGKMPLTCELGCGAIVRREYFEHHRRRVCEEELVKCPFVEYKCISVVKRREMKHHLEEYKDAHTTLKLNFMENNFKILSKQLQTLNTFIVEELKFKNKELEFLQKEIDVLNIIAFRKEETLKWVIGDISEKFRKAPQMTFLCNSRAYDIDGYKFNFRHSTDETNFSISFKSIIALTNSSWPFRAVFITQVLSPGNPNNLLKFISPLIEQYREEFIQPNNRGNVIASIPLATNLKDYTKSDSLELNITVRFFKLL